MSQRLDTRGAAPEGAPAAPSDDASAADEAGGTELRRSLAAILVTYTASRMLVYAVALIAARRTAGGDFLGVTVRWDAAWYLDIVTNGYDRAIPGGIGDAAQTNIAFFPAVPLLGRALTFVTGLDPRVVGLVVGFVTGAAGAVGVYVLARRLVTEETARRSAVLFSFFPGAAVLGTYYTEGLFVAAAAGCLVALLSRRWLLAGGWAALGGATRPNGFLLAACIAWVALPFIARHRSWGQAWRPLVALLVAPLGTFGYLGFLTLHTGRVDAYVVVQNQGWGQGVELWPPLLTRVQEVLDAPFNSEGLMVWFLANVLLVVLFALLILWRPPSVLIFYSVATMIPSLLAIGVSGIPRYTLAAVPLLIALARAVPQDLWAGVIAVSAVAMSGLALLHFGTLAVIP